MKMMHLSDLHLGKRVNEFSMIQDQEHILKQILEIADREQAEAVLISGDVYDKPIPPVEAVALLDQFLVELGKRRISVFMISGNHDSVQRLSFGNRLFQAGGLYIASEYHGTLEEITLTDDFGTIHVYLLPFVKPAHVRLYEPEVETGDYTGAIRAALTGAPRNPEDRNVLLSHQFVTGASRCESEEISVGGLDNVDAQAYEGFDYVALGHIHGPQNIHGGTIRYCGTPLKYSFSEAGHEKSVTMVELREKGTVEITTIPLNPLRDMRQIRGTYMEVTSREFYREFNTEDYIQVTLTDEEDVPDAMAKLRIIYPNLMKMNYDNQRTQREQQVEGAQQVEQKSPMELFEELFRLQNNQEMSPQQREASLKLMEKIWEGEI